MPPLRELRGIGDIVHDFYTGIERVFDLERFLAFLDAAARSGTTSGPA